MPRIDSIVSSFEHEAATTRRALQAVPEEHFGWKPHEKSFTLGRLAGHIAEMPGWAGNILSGDDLDFAAERDPDLAPLHPATHAELMAAFEAKLDVYRQATAGVSDERLAGKWCMRRGDKVLREMPRVAALDSFILRHVIHHRGQLSVYLRLLDVPVPPMYGPTADDRAGFE